MLYWLRKHPSTLKTFVRYRVKEIKELYDETNWHHLRTHENSTDIAFRGALPNELKNVVGIRNL